MTVTEFEIRPGVYYDSVVLMQLQKTLTELPGVLDAGAVMATPANRELLKAAGFEISNLEAKPDDLIIAVMADDETAATNAIDQIDELIKRRRAMSAVDYHPHSIAAAHDYLPESAWVLISVPGRFAAEVANDSLELGQHVFLYSDNVEIADEIALKDKARDKGLLMMGPDCGTAIIHGVGLGFANRVRRGSIGLIAASGTGLQAVTTGIHNLGGGVSQAFGTGGRDLKVEIGGSTTIQALDLLGKDPRTDVIVLISKPIDASLAARVTAAARNTGKPTVINFIGYPPPGRQIDNLVFATSLQEAAELAVSLVGKEGESSPASVSTVSAKYLRGLFSGGTLAYEMLLGLQTFLTPLFSNIPLREEQKIPDVLVSQAHTILDLGEDEFTQGRLHPMIDHDLRLRRLRQEAADPEVGVIVLDVVLGEGAHPDPAAVLAPAIAEIVAERGLLVLAIVVGTEQDPQGLDGQIEALSQAGAVVVRNSSEAVAIASQWLAVPTPYPYSSVSLEGLGDALVAINVGLESFYDSLKAQGARTVHVEWRPPAGGKDNLMAILTKMKNL